MPVYTPAKVKQLGGGSFKLIDWADIDGIPPFGSGSGGPIITFPGADEMANLNNMAHLTATEQSQSLSQLGFHLDTQVCALFVLPGSDAVYWSMGSPASADTPQINSAGMVVIVDMARASRLHFFGDSAAFDVYEYING